MQKQRSAVITTALLELHMQNSTCGPGSLPRSRSFISAGWSGRHVKSSQSPRMLYTIDGKICVDSLLDPFSFASYTQGRRKQTEIQIETIRKLYSHTTVDLLDNGHLNPIE